MEQSHRKRSPEQPGAVPDIADFAAAMSEGGEPTGTQRLFALKEGDSFLVADAQGDIAGNADGFFREDTRVLSLYRLTIGGRTPTLLSAAISQDSVIFTAHMTNRPLPRTEQGLPMSVVHLERQRLLWEGSIFEHIRCTNYGDSDLALPLTLNFDADFRDIFEVRGERRMRRGRTLPATVSASGVLLAYVGLDYVTRSVAIGFSPTPSVLEARRAEFDISLPRRGQADIYVKIGRDSIPRPSAGSHRTATVNARLAVRRRRMRSAPVVTSGRVFNAWLARSRADLAILTTDLRTGPYPFAGVPWFSTPFGRDAIITSLQTLWLDPGLARGVLAYLASTQAQEQSDFYDSAPGKILHETRKGEMAALGEVPFGKYYGSVDATPLFVVLAGAYAQRTGDVDFIDEIWPALQAAANWIETSGDQNGDGLVDYARQRDSGLVNQGWKDSQDSIFHADGTIPSAPITLVEVQAYVFAAWRALAMLARWRGDQSDAARWRRMAYRVRAAVEERFWIEELRFYGLALDGAGKLCRVRTSNAAHLLYLGVPSPERGAEVATQLISGEFDSGWGVRTLTPDSVRYNPLSYHNGSIWPHDTAIAAAGLARYGRRDGAVKLLSQMFEAAVHFESRLPELFCGFDRASGAAPISYPVACLPQAWAAGSVFMMLQACLGVSIDGRKHEIHIDRPSLPIGIDRLRIERLEVGDARLNLDFHRIDDRVVVSIPADQPDTRTVKVMVHL